MSVPSISKTSPRTTRPCSAAAAGCAAAAAGCAAAGRAPLEAILGLLKVRSVLPQATLRSLWVSMDERVPAVEHPLPWRLL